TCWFRAMGCHGGRIKIPASGLSSATSVRSPSMADPALPGPAPAAPPSRSPLITAGGIVLAIGALHFGRDIFIPFALAILLSFTLAPVVNWLRRWRVPRLAAVLIAVTLALIVIAGIGFLVARQLVQLAD